MPPFILASASSIRAQLLSEIGVPFIVQVSDFDESSITTANPKERAQILAVHKAQVVAAAFPHAIVLGCDTVIESTTGELYEKPIDAADASRMLESYSNSYCDVHTGICIFLPNKAVLQHAETTRVYYRHCTPSLIHWWLQSNLWQGKAGGLQYEKEGQILIKRIEGDASNVMGLPVHQLTILLEQAAYPITGFLS